MNSVADSDSIPVTVRSFTKADAEVCRQLYLEGPMGRPNASNDTGLDIDDIEAAYMRSPDSHFWVAQTAKGEIVGMIGVQQHQSGEGEIRRLRVRHDVRRRGIGSALLEAAIQFCREKQHLKVILDTAMDMEPAVKLFEKFRFRHTRTRTLDKKNVLYFYLDLYTGDPHRKR
jgi:ribosomal protein S18 acetylase RimI-like enzyme